MPRKIKSTKSKLTAPPFQASIKGLDINGLDTILTVTGADADQFCLNLDAARAVMPLRPFGTKSDAAETHTPPAPVSDAPKCPKCGGACYDNRVRRGENDQRPLLKCQDQSAACAWKLWKSPRNAAEIADAALWTGAK